MTAAKTHLVNVPLFYRENLTCLRTAGAINKAFPLYGQKRADIEQIAADTALQAIALTGKKLMLNVFFPEMNQPETPHLTGGMKHKTGIINRPR
jgi:hypothetical protein